MKEVIQTEHAPKPLGPYSQAIKAGNFLFVSGQVAVDPKKGVIVAKGIQAQTTRVMENIKSILEAADYGFSDIIQSDVYLSSINLFKDFNSEYAKYFVKEFPTRATIGVMLVPKALIEISVVAYKE